MNRSRVLKALPLLVLGAGLLQPPAALGVELQFDVSSVDPALTPTAGAAVRFSQDLQLVRRWDSTPLSSEVYATQQALLDYWQSQLDLVDFEELDQSGRIDFILLQAELRYRQSELTRNQTIDSATLAVLPFAESIIDLAAAQRNMQPIDGAQAAQRLTQLVEQIEAAAARLENQQIELPQHLALRAANQLDQLRRTLGRWRRHYDGYDPQFSWWTRTEFKAADKQLQDFTGKFRSKLVGGDSDTLIGEPIGRDALLISLQHELIPYEPERLIEIAEKELAWCRREQLRAAQELGFGGDWQAAQDHVKQLHVGPGKQPELIRKLAWEAVDFLEDRDLVTIPPLCRSCWRLEMMSPERQRVTPYFTGGEVISVSFPTEEMSYADKLMSMRGNNIHFSRATVHHELIPGHHLQGWMAQRYNVHRRLFNTPFLVEGWALYWEMLLWDLDFPQSAEDRIGMLFWRSHRCARIIFSLKFHLEQMTADEAVDFLVREIGHERRNATAEVRRSINGSYDPLYQAAYMLGGLQLRRLHQELVASGVMPIKEFHDRVLLENSIPIELIRASLANEPLERDFRPSWRFYD